MRDLRQVQKSVSIETTLEVAYEALTQASELREWFSDQAWTEAEPGGRYEVRWHQGYRVDGEFVELDAPHRVSLNWWGTGEPGKTTVEFTLEPAGSGVEVTVLHSGFRTGTKWDKALAESEKGWLNGLQNLKSTLETGVDLRIARQPFLGIHLDLLNAEQAAKEGIAVERGIYVTGTVEGSGAEAAGLSHGDVIEALGGVPTLGLRCEATVPAIWSTWTWFVVRSGRRHGSNWDAVPRRTCPPAQRSWQSSLHSGRPRQTLHSRRRSKA